MTASETGREIPADELQEWANTLGFLRHADALQGRAASFRRLHGNMLMYGEGQALGDEHAATALRSAAMLVASLIARIASLEAERARTRRETMLEAAESAKAWRVVPDDFIVPGAMTAEDLVVARRTAKGIEDHLRELASEKGGQADG